MSDPIDTEGAPRVRSAAAQRYLEAREARRTAKPELLPEPPPPSEDTLWRGLLRDGQMRLMVARAGRAGHAISTGLDCRPVADRFVRELVLATQLVRSTLNPDETLQLAGFQQGGVGNFVVDVFEDGGVRATLRHPEATGPALAGGTLQVTRQQRGRGQYRSSVAFDEGDRTTDVLMRYLLESEQILTLLDVDVAPERGDHGLAAVGSIVQLMPEGSREDLARLVKNLEASGKLGPAMVEDDPDAVAWAERLLDGFYWDQVARQELAFHCPCSAERVVALLASLPPDDLREVLDGLEVVESTCDYCRTTYTTPVDQLQALLGTPS